MNDTTLPLPSCVALDDPERRQWLRATGAAGGVAVVLTATPFVTSFTPSERARAQGAAIEVELADIPPGGLKTVEWRGKPVWILRRTPEQLTALQGQEAELVDPGSARQQQPDYACNPARAIRPEFLVAVGICTHLGCSPNFVPAGSGNHSVGANWQGGFFCPCHGSTFDMAGRVFRNKPAPTNLEIPPHRYVSASRLLIGEGQG